MVADTLITPPDQWPGWPAPQSSSLKSSTFKCGECENYPNNTVSLGQHSYLIWNMFLLNAVKKNQCFLDLVYVWSFTVLHCTGLCVLPNLLLVYS